MSMTVVVTRDAPPRFRGFLASCMLEVAPGVYSSPRMNKAVRERVWDVLTEWHRFHQGCGVVMIWSDNQAACGQSVQSLGIPPRWLIEKDGLILSWRAPTASELESLEG